MELQQFSEPGTINSSAVTSSYSYNITKIIKVIMGIGKWNLCFSSWFILSSNNEENINIFL